MWVSVSDINQIELPNSSAGGIVRRHAYGVSARYMLADYVILAGRADKLTFILQETGYGTIIELSIANA